MGSAPITRSTRIVCISDTFGTQPLLPPGDILLHAGNATRTGSPRQLRRTLTWLSNAHGFKLKILIPGPHDITLDWDFYREYGAYFHHRQQHHPPLSLEEQVDACLSLLSKFPSITYLCHVCRVFTLDNGDGMKTRFSLFASPYVPSRGLWAFGYPPEDGARVWARIPLEADIVLTHSPPRYHCDEGYGRGSAGGGPGNARGAQGCEDLRRALWRVRPRLVVCGGVGQGWGVEVVRWDLGCKNVRFKEGRTIRREGGEGFVQGWNERRWESGLRVDLTGSDGGRALQNDGSKGQTTGFVAALLKARGREVSADEHDDLQSETPKRAPAGTLASHHHFLNRPYRELREDDDEHNRLPIRSAPTADLSQFPFPDSNLAERPIRSFACPHPIQPSTYGLGGLPPTARCDFEALFAREGRRETCVVNAAVADAGGAEVGRRKLNGPIVVDIQLPVVGASEEG